MKRHILFSVLALVTVSSSGAIPDFEDTFDTLYVNGQDFTVLTNGWQASGPQAYVTNAGGYVLNAVYMDSAVTMTNRINGGAPAKVWTDLEIKPVPGIRFDNPTNEASCLCYFDTNGAVVVATPGGWRVCSNDIWGASVPPVADAYVRISIFQDFRTSNQVFFLNGQLLVQDLPFVGSASNYNQLEIRNPSGSCWLDSVWVKTVVPAGLNQNLNHDAENMSDANEVHAYGYASRTLYVGSGSGYPSFATVREAVDTWRPRDTIHVYGGTYAEDLVITNNVVFTGEDFSLGGRSLTVATGASVSMAQSLSCDALSVSGAIAMGQGASITSTTALVSGALSLSTNGGLVVGTLSITGSGSVGFSNGRLLASAVGIDMSGTFSLSSAWGTAATVSLPFADDFELYADNTPMTDLGFRGWYASDGRVKVQGSVVNKGSRAVVLPDGTILSNSVTSGPATKIWTDVHVLPTLGVLPPSPPTNSVSFLAYANTNGVLEVATTNGWYSCSNTFVGSTVPALSSNGFYRLTVCQDLSNHLFAVFVDGNLVGERLALPAPLSTYSSFAANNQSGTAYLDDVLISTQLPPGMTNDLDHNGFADAYEINIAGTPYRNLPGGATYLFR